MRRQSHHLLKQFRAFFLLSIAAAWLLVTSNTSSAENIIFTIDPNQSVESWSGADNTFGPYSAQPGGSLSTSVFGNFVVSFDPTTSAPTTIQIVGNNPGNNNGYYQLNNSGNYAPFGTPANLGGQTAGGLAQFAVQGLSFNLQSGPLTANSSTSNSSTYTATSTNFNVLNGGINFASPGVGPATDSYVASTGTITGGDWTLTQTTPGDWSLALNAFYTYTYHYGAAQGVFTATGDLIATAVFNPATNTATVTPSSGGSSADVLGGAGATGGVTANFQSNVTGGSLSVQEVPGLSSLTTAASTAAAANPEFLLSTASADIGAPQIWSVDFSGDLNGGTSTLVFNYDPTLLPVGFDQSQLGIWHFNDILNQWVFGGTVDVADHTISFTTSSFSPFELGARPVPEPSSLALVGIAMLSIWLYRRRQSSCSIMA